ncbi:MAG: alpha/beta hydrolase [Chloroflexi bacterium]|nr:alpha/beta hydrolase [Chloroflexota bacterium]
MTTVSSIQGRASTGQREQHRRGCLALVGRLAKWFGIVLLALMVLGAVYQVAATEADRRAFAPRGQLYDVGGYPMHLYCTGEGSPTVVLDAGAVGLSAWVQAEVAQTTRVCAFDRAGYGYSDARPEPRDALHRAAELHGLLAAAGIEPPYVLAGHSLGGLFSRVYQRQYPDEVAGLVLIDATHPDTFERQGESIQTMQAMASISSVAARVGLMRLVAGGSSFSLPESDNAALKAEMGTNQYWDSQRADLDAFEATLAQGRDSGALNDLPLAVLVALTYPEGPSRDTERALQVELAALSSNTVYEEIEGAGHNTLLTDKRYAAQVSEAIDAVVGAVRSGEPLVQ